MTIQELLRALRERGASLSYSGTDLTLVAKKHSIDETVLATLRAKKDEILAQLAEEHALRERRVGFGGREVRRVGAPCRPRGVFGRGHGRSLAPSRGSGTVRRDRTARRGCAQVRVKNLGIGRKAHWPRIRPNATHHLRRFVDADRRRTACDS